MMVLKNHGKIFGAKLNKTEQRALDMEIKRELAEWDKKHMHELDAVILMVLHLEFGFGIDRMKRYYQAWGNAMRDLLGRYELETDNPDDTIWLAQNRLKDLGVDLEAWQKGEFE